jgi:hypothetical protein
VVLRRPPYRPLHCGGQGLGGNLDGHWCKTGGAVACRIFSLLFVESMQSRGDSCSGRGFNVVIGGAKVGIAPPERPLERAVQDRVGAWIGRWLRLLSRLAHQWTRVEAGIPSLAIRLSALHPIFASVF